MKEEKNTRNTYLLTASDKSKEWDQNNCKEYYDEFKEKKDSLISDWSTGNTKSIKKGDRFFFMKLGNPPRGIVASGEVTKGHYKQGSKNFIGIKFEKFCDPDKEDSILLLEELEKLNETNKANEKKQHWTSQISGIIIRPHIAPKLEKIWEKHLKKI